jgi:hypothetical protein
MYAHESHAHKRHAYGIHAYEMHAYEIHARERGTFIAYVPELHILSDTRLRNARL